MEEHWSHWGPHGAHGGPMGPHGPPMGPHGGPNGANVPPLGEIFFRKSTQKMKMGPKIQNANFGGENTK